MKFDLDHMLAGLPDGGPLVLCDVSVTLHSGEPSESNQVWPGVHDAEVKHWSVWSAPIGGELLDSGSGDLPDWLADTRARWLALMEDDDQ